MQELINKIMQETYKNEPIDTRKSILIDLKNKFKEDLSTLSKIPVLKVLEQHKDLEAEVADLYLEIYDDLYNNFKSDALKTLQNQITEAFIKPTTPEVFREKIIDELLFGASLPQLLNSCPRAMIINHLIESAARDSDGFSRKANMFGKCYFQLVNIMKADEEKSILNKALLIYAEKSKGRNVDIASRFYFCDRNKREKEQLFESLIEHKEIVTAHFDDMVAMYPDEIDRIMARVPIKASNDKKAFLSPRDIPIDELGELLAITWMHQIWQPKALSKYFPDNNNFRDNPSKIKTVGNYESKRKSFKKFLTNSATYFKKNANYNSEISVYTDCDYSPNFQQMLNGVSFNFPRNSSVNCIQVGNQIRLRSSFGDRPDIFISYKPVQTIKQFKEESDYQQAELRKRLQHTWPKEQVDDILNEFRIEVQFIIDDFEVIKHYSRISFIRSEPQKTPSMLLQRIVNRIIGFNQPFEDFRRQICQECDDSEPYINNFFSELGVELSSCRDKKQCIEKVTALAQKHFEHQTPLVLRALADIFILITSLLGLGLLIATSNKYRTGSYFFSTAHTREALLATKLVESGALDEALIPGEKSNFK